MYIDQFKKIDTKDKAYTYRTASRRWMYFYCK